MPRQPHPDKIHAIYDYLTSLQIELCDVLDGPHDTFRADSAALLKVLEDYYRTHLYQRLTAKR